MTAQTVSEIQTPTPYAPLDYDRPAGAPVLAVPLLGLVALVLTIVLLVL